jgi:hypothetical protein
MRARQARITASRLVRPAATAAAISPAVHSFNGFTS